MSNLISLNPTTYKKLGTVKISSLKEIQKKVKLAHKAKEDWSGLGVRKRVDLLRKVFKEIEQRKSELLSLQAHEVGMPISQANADFVGTMKYANWYFDNAHKYINPEIVSETKDEIHILYHEPIGVEAVIIPWNFPFANFVWAGLQSLVSGNVIILKHSEECPMCGKFLEEVFTNYLPDGVFNEIYGAAEVGKTLLDQAIDMIAFTGSTRTGKAIFEHAGKKFIKSVMELGGSAPGVIFDDAALDLATIDVCSLRLFNTGQCCDGLKRLIVHEKIYDQVVNRVKQIFVSKKIGNPTKKSTEVGPLVAKRQLELLKQQVKDAVNNGARIVVGGKSLEKEYGGAYYQPTVITHVRSEMRVWKEEVFGPVLPIVKFSTDSEAILLANDTCYGLGAYIYSGDVDRATRVAEQIETGMVSINGKVYKIPSNPFGGNKNSGMGRIHGLYGFHEVTKTKIVARSK